MYEKGHKNGIVRFAIKPHDGANAVAVAGDFSDWRPVPLWRDKGGVFVRRVPVSQETFEYKFVVDGQWINDPDNIHYAKNPFGTFNSIAPGEVDAVMRL